MNLEADICLPKMVAGLLSPPKRQFYPSENNTYSFYLLYENFMLHFAKENASQITLQRTDMFTETSRLVPLINK